MAKIKIVQVKENYRLQIEADDYSYAGVELTPDDINRLYDFISRIYFRETDFFEMQVEEK